MPKQAVFITIRVVVLGHSPFIDPKPTIPIHSVSLWGTHFTTAITSPGQMGRMGNTRLSGVLVISKRYGWVGG